MLQILWIEWHITAAARLCLFLAAGKSIESATENVITIKRYHRIDELSKNNIEKIKTIYVFCFKYWSKEALISFL